MESTSEINWTTILWVAGGILTFFFGIISGLLGWIGIMQRETKKTIYLKNVEQDQRLDKHDDKFEKVHDEIHEIQLANMKTLTLMEKRFKK